MKPQDFVEYRIDALQRIDEINDDLRKAEQRVRKKCKKPRKHRKADAQDLVPDAVIWHENDGEWFWAIVESSYEAGYTDVDGSNYYLRNAYVEIFE